MKEYVSIVKVDSYGNVTETEVMEIPDGINVKRGDRITEKGNCIIVERKNFMCDIYLKNKYEDTATEVLKDFELHHYSDWCNPRIKYFGNEVAFLNSNEWDNKLINLLNGKIIAEETKECHFYDVEGVVSPIQRSGDSLYILNYSLATSNERYGAKQYLLMDKDGKKILPLNFVGRHNKIESADGIGDILLLHYIDTSKGKYGMISVQCVGEDYIVKPIVNREYDNRLSVDYKHCVKDVHGNIHCPCIKGRSQDKSIHYYNIMGQRLKLK